MISEADYFLSPEKISRLEKVKNFIDHLEGPEDLNIETLNFIYNLIDDQTAHSPENNIIVGLEKVDLNRSGFKGLNQRRSEMELLAFILKAARKGVNKTEILYKANMSGRQLSKYLGFLINAGLIRKVCEKKKVFFKTSSKGGLFLYLWVKILQLLETEINNQK
jgi:predicted transcriptional regulator